MPLVREYPKVQNCDGENVRIRFVISSLVHVAMEVDLSRGNGENMLLFESGRFGTFDGTAAC